jgi:hypothetical protein
MKSKKLIASLIIIFMHFSIFAQEKLPDGHYECTITKNDNKVENGYLITETYSKDSFSEELLQIGFLFVNKENYGSSIVKKYKIKIRPDDILKVNFPGREFQSLSVSNPADRLAKNKTLILEKIIAGELNLFKRLVRKMGSAEGDNRSMHEKANDVNAYAGTVETFYYISKPMEKEALTPTKKNLEKMLESKPEILKNYQSGIYSIKTESKTANKLGKLMGKMTNLGDLPEANLNLTQLITDYNNLNITTK